MRDQVKESIEKCQKAGITVRMITGDNAQTAFAIAKECGILPVDTPKADLDNYVITGQKFNELSGGTREVFKGMPNGEDLKCDEYSICEFDDRVLEEHKHQALKLIKEGHSLTKKYMVKNLQWFKDHIEDIRVMARSQPVDKFTMVTGLMQLGHIVAVTGDGANDASALSKSNVGFAMGIAGTQAAKEACDIVILDDNFTSIVKAVLWGRNVFDGVRKFLQFQLSVNIVAVVTTFFSALFDEGSHSTLTAVQLLWVNMIMDSLGALALATDPPTEKLLDRKPYKRAEKIINKRILYSVLIVGLFQVAVISVFLYASHLFVPCGYQMGTQDWDMFCTPEG